MSTDALHPGQLATRLVSGDLSEQLLAACIARGVAALDSETTGLDWRTASLELVQVHVPDVGTELVKISADASSPNLVALLGRPDVLKVFHHAVFDLGFFRAKWGATTKNVACTKVAAKLLWPGDGDRQRLMPLVKEHLGVELDKTQQTSDWSQAHLSRAQIEYATNDVRYLLPLLEALSRLLEQRERLELARQCWAHLSTHVELDHLGIPNPFTY